MTDQHQALYRAICTHPDEDTPRLMYADLLEENGDPDQAAFIRTQVAIARVPEYDPVHITTRQLSPDALTGWSMAHTLPQVPGGYAWNTFEFRRGFPWKVGVLSLDAFVRRGAAIFEAAPIQALAIDARGRPDLGVLADWEHLPRIRRLEFSLGHVGPNGMARLGEAPNAANLTELAFDNDGITAAGLEALVRSDVFPNLAVLELRSNVIPPALIVDALGARRDPGALGRLSLASNRISRYDVAHLFSLPVIHGLQHLDLSDNNLSVEGVQSLADSGALRGLRVLNLSKTNPGVPGVRSLSENSGFASVRSLDLSENRLGPVAVKFIAQSMGAKGLRALNLARNPVGDAGAVALGGSKALAGLLELDLADAGLNDAGALALAESPYLGGLLRLNLCKRSVGPAFGPEARTALVKRFGRRVAF